MTAILGKRKRRIDLGDQDGSKDSSKSTAADRLQALLQKHFEEKYEPLEIAPNVPPTANSESGSEAESDGQESWDGISDDDASAAIEVIDHSKANTTKDSLSKEERKNFMSAKPPQPLREPKSQKRGSVKDTEDPSTEAALRKNDLALQRLLQESHLLDASTPDDFSVTGKARQKALDLRLQSLGSKQSLLKQKSMPMSIRKGINDKSRVKEDTRRAEARENGIILEKEKKEVKKQARRERGVGAPSVGKFKGGTLQLSRKDLRSIQGPTTERGKGGKKGKRR